MNQFLQPNPAAFDDLRRKATGNIYRFRNVRLPQCAQPPTADVGFEVNPSNNQATLWVSKGVTLPPGAVVSVKEWLDRGMKHFANFDGLVTWMHGDFAQEFRRDSAASSISPEIARRQMHSPTSGYAIEGITDLAAVERGMANSGGLRAVSAELIRTGLEQKVFGQAMALEAMAGAVSRQMGRTEPSRPAVLFAVGPSGVGKTRSAEYLPQVLNTHLPRENAYQYLRLDMSEYQEAHRVSQLIGAPQGYLGHGESSQLIDAVRKNPRTVLLFDEIEKAHPSILRVLMNAMDAGRLSSAASNGVGHQVDCRQCIFIFTSNLEARGLLADVAALGADATPKGLDDACRQRLLGIARHCGSTGLQGAAIAPEILGRIGRFLVFQTVEGPVRSQIMVAAVVETAREYGLHVLKMPPELVVRLLQGSDSADFGARADRVQVDDLLGDIFLAAKAADAEYIELTNEAPYWHVTQANTN